MKTDHMEFPNPVGAEQRERDWPPSHDIGIFISAGDVMTLIGTARDANDLAFLFRGLAVQWDRMLGEPDWFFTDFL